MGFQLNIGSSRAHVPTPTDTAERYFGGDIKAIRSLYRMRSGEPQRKALQTWATHVARATQKDWRERLTEIPDGKKKMTMWHHSQGHGYWRAIQIVPKGYGRSIILKLPGRNYIMPVEYGSKGFGDSGPYIVQRHRPGGQPRYVTQRLGVSLRPEYAKIKRMSGASNKRIMLMARKGIFEQKLGNSQTPEIQRALSLMPKFRERVFITDEQGNPTYRTIRPRHPKERLVKGQEYHLVKQTKPQRFVYEKDAEGNIKRDENGKRIVRQVATKAQHRIDMQQWLAALEKSYTVQKITEIHVKKKRFGKPTPEMYQAAELLHSEYALQRQEDLKKTMRAIHPGKVPKGYSRNELAGESEASLRIKEWARQRFGEGRDSNPRMAIRGWYSPTLGKRGGRRRDSGYALQRNAYRLLVHIRQSGTGPAGNLAGVLESLREGQLRQTMLAEANKAYRSVYGHNVRGYTTDEGAG